MQVKYILEAEQEAIRFLSKLKELKESESNGYIFQHFNNDRDFTDNSKETASLRRSSMDLTRALSNLRNIG